MDQGVPILAFHRVGPRRDCRFTVPLDIFEQYLKAIREEGFSTLTCTDLVSILAGRAALPPRACVLTFDDGSADVWVYAVPLLRRHGMRGTVFALLNRVRDNGPPRLTVEDVWSGHARMADLYQLPDLPWVNAQSLDPEYSPATDHLSWEELGAIARDGTCDVQSHGLDHLVHYISDRLRGFLNPQSHWMAVAAAGSDPRLGTPVYEIGSSLAQPAYLDSPLVRDRLAHLVARTGSDDFFKQVDWQEILRREFDAARAEAGSGSHQSEEAWRQDALEGFRRCIRVMSARIGAAVQCLSWPFGVTSGRAQAIASKAGFVLAFTAQCGGYAPGMPPACVGRVSVKEHDVTKLRFALRRYSRADVIREEAAGAVYDHALAMAR